MRGLDVLVVGAHPDDIEVGSGGYLLLCRDKGVQSGAIDLTAGERASSGTPQDRDGESQRAAERLQLVIREQLGLPDTEVSDTPPARRALVAVLRRWRPRLLIGPSGDDPHPDHEAAARLVRSAWFLSGVAGYEQDLGPAYRPPRHLEMVVRPGRRPEILLPIDDVWQEKCDLLMEHESQFGRTNPHRLGAGNPLREVDAVASSLGALAGCERAEGFNAPSGWVTSELLPDVLAREAASSRNSNATCNEPDAMRPGPVELP
ncbi:MAG: PIG-L family deacetylase [Planctomycetota bacterium]|jgi:bacillithiol biosynthesis deacetylase BshB1